MNPNYYLETCPLGHDASKLRHSSLIMREGALRSCDVCGQLVSACTKEVYDSTMQEFDTPEGTWPGHKSIGRAYKVSKARLELIAGYLHKSPQEIKLLDLGCSSGSFLEVAKTMGFKAEGLEPAYSAAKAAQEKGFTVHIGTIESVNLPEKSFDAITLFEVIEHIPNPVILLNHCRRILKPGGVIMIGTANTHSWTRKIMKTRWDYFDMAQHGGHISFFNKKSMKMLASICHLKPIYIKTRALKFFERHETSNVIYRVTKVVSELLSPVAKWLNLGHDMLAILQRE